MPLGGAVQRAAVKPPPERQPHEYTPLTRMGGLGAEAIQLFKIDGEVKFHLNRITTGHVLVVTVHVGLQLPTIAHYLLPPLLERDLHVSAGCRAGDGSAGPDV